MAIIGMFFQVGLTVSAWDDWALYTDAPLRAYENEAGVQAPSAFGTRTVCLPATAPFIASGKAWSS